MTQLLTAPALTDVILRRELIDAGYTDRAIAQLVKRGDLVKLRHGAYAPAQLWSAASRVGRVQLLTRAVLRQSRTDLVVSHGTAMAEHGDALWELPLDTTHVTCEGAHAGRKEAGVTQHQGQLLPGDVVTRNGVQVTSGTRTAIDITTVAGVEAALAAVNHLLHSGLTTEADLWERYATMTQHPFTLNTDLVFRLADPRIESVGESRTFFLFWRHGIPIPVQQLTITDGHGHPVARLDFAWPDRQGGLSSTACRST